MRPVFLLVISLAVLQTVLVLAYLCVRASVTRYSVQVRVYELDIQELLWCVSYQLLPAAFRRDTEFAESCSFVHLRQMPA